MRTLLCSPDSSPLLCPRQPQHRPRLAARLSPKNPLCPPALARRAGRCVWLPGQPAPHPRCLFRQRLDTVSGRVSNHSPCSQWVHSQPEAQGVSKRPARQSWQGGGDLWPPPGRSPLLPARTHSTLCPASSRLRHLWRAPQFSSRPDFLALLLFFCSGLCSFSCPAERDVSIVRLC